ncbi:MAG: hypothetical protein LC749_13555 [Actinobacteria bacterium]|nr:hypothetical protein [Actinomycetota bacterium]
MISVVNHSTLVTNADVQIMTRACWSQLYWHAAPAWRLTPMPVIYASSETTAPPGSWVIGIFDDSDQSGALGWHSEANGISYGRVFARPVLTHGGNALSGPLSVASVLSHECLETFVDPSCNKQADRGDGTAIALECGDPVESDSYIVKVSGTPVAVSNFVHESWFDPQSHAPWDHMGKCTGPFRMSPGGYEIETTEGQTRPVFAAEYPEWRREMKDTPLARSARRIPVSDLTAGIATAGPGTEAVKEPGLLDRFFGKK